MKPEFLIWAGRRVLRISGGMSDDNADAVLRGDYDELCLSGGEFTDLSLLVKAAKKIQRLHVTGAGQYDLDAIEDLSQLEYLRLETSAKFIPERAFDFSSFPALEACHVYWRKGYQRNLFSLGKLKKLRLFDYDRGSLEELSGLSGLQELSLSQSAASDLTGVESLRLLESLTISNMHRLASIEALRALPALRRLKIQKAPKLNLVGLLPLFEVATLEEFTLGSGYELPNLEPFAKLVSLREFVTGSQLEVQNFSILFNLPKLKHVRFIGLRNYTDSDDDLERWARLAGHTLTLEVIGRGRKEQTVIFNLD